MRIVICVLVLNEAVPMRCLLHDNSTMHPAISESAAKLSAGLTTYLADYFGSADLNQPRIMYYEEGDPMGSYGPLDWFINNT